MLDCYGTMKGVVCLLIVALREVMRKYSSERSIDTEILVILRPLRIFAGVERRLAEMHVRWCVTMLFSGFRLENQLTTHLLQTE